jgi:hypothetical protein
LRAYTACRRDFLIQRPVVESAPSNLVALTAGCCKRRERGRESLLKLRREELEPALVQGFRHIAFDFEAEAVVVVIHLLQNAAHRLGRVRRVILVLAARSHHSGYAELTPGSLEPSGPAKPLRVAVSRKRGQQAQVASESHPTRT